MGTRSTVKFYSEHKEDKIVLSVYQQYDGYIDGVGHDLANFLKDKKVINGFGQTHETMKLGYANGMGCLAAQYVASNKTQIGGFYMTDVDDSQEYDYEVRLIDGEINIKVDYFDGTPQELLDYKKKDDG